MSYVKLLDEFDPNLKSKKPWATFIPNRYPNFKVHSRIQDAMAAIGRHEHGILYEVVNDRWEQLVRKCPEDYRGVCQSCGFACPEVKRWDGTTIPGSVDGRFAWKRYRGKLVKPIELLYCCPDCVMQFT